MLPKPLRLPLRKEGNFFDKAQRFYSDGISSFFVPSVGDLKFDVIAKKSDFSLSTTRHKMIRRAHQAIEEIINKKPQRLGHFVFVLSKSVLTTPLPELVVIFNKHLNQFSKTV